MPQQSFTSLYEDASRYQDQKISTGGGTTEWDAARLLTTASAIAAALSSPESAILDVGCANGGLLDALRSKGYHHLVGLDPSYTCVMNTLRRGCVAFQGTLDAMPDNLVGFDAVVLSHVLEHVRDLRSALAGLRRALRPGSLVYIEVPDASRYCDFLSAPFQDFNTEHINHFSATCLRNLALRCGFTPLGNEVEKSIPSSADTLYPAVFGFYEYTGNDQNEITPDRVLADRIRRYVRLSSALMESMDNHLTRELAGCHEVVLWGAGQLAMKLLREEPLSSANIRACIDSNPDNQGCQLQGIPVLSPPELRGFDCPVVIASTLHESDIRRDIQAFGLTNRLISLRVQTSGTVI